MDLSIIIVSWNVRAHLARCLASIRRLAEEAGDGISFEVFVVDNASTDGTQALLASVKVSECQSLEVILNKKNVGFAAANNQAIRRARGEFILLLNPDTEFTTSLFHGLKSGLSSRGVTPGGGPPLSPSSEAMRSDGGAGRQDPEPLKEMIHFMGSHPKCGILGPMLRNVDGTLQPSVRRFPRAIDPILFSIGVTPKKYCMTDFDYTKERQVDQVMGAAFLIRRTMLEQIGMLDERFFIWFEEVDYCRRAKEAGWEVWYTPDAAVLHHGGESFAQILTLRKQWVYSQSLLRYFAKYHAWGAWALNALLIIPRLCVALILYRHAHHRS